MYYLCMEKNGVLTMCQLHILSSIGHTFFSINMLSIQVAVYLHYVGISKCTLQPLNIRCITVQNFVNTK